MRSRRPWHGSRTAFAAAARARPDPDALRLKMTGPGVFAVESRATIKGEVTRIALLATLVIVTLLLFIYRSLPLLLLGLFPVATGVLAGIAAVSVGFGVVHGLTIGFGVTLIGEAVDYGIYLFIQRGGAESEDEAMAAFWPTIRLGLLTSVCGFGVMLASGFPGLAQLGLFSVTGLVAAALVARWVLPALLPSGLEPRDLGRLGRRLAVVSRWLARLRWLVPVLCVAAVSVIWLHRDGLWNDSLMALSPVSPAAQALDARLRGELGAPETSQLIVVDAPDRERALRQSEALAAPLDALVAQGVIAGWDGPARYLPSQATQRARLASLPEPAVLAARLDEATATLPLKAARLAPFLAEVAAARAGGPVTDASLSGTSFALAVEAMLRETGNRLARTAAAASGGRGEGGRAARLRAGTSGAGRGPGAGWGERASTRPETGVRCTLRGLSARSHLAVAERSPRHPDRAGRCIALAATGREGHPAATRRGAGGDGGAGARRRVADPAASGGSAAGRGGGLELRAFLRARGRGGKRSLAPHPRFAPVRQSDHAGWLRTAGDLHGAGVAGDRGDRRSRGMAGVALCRDAELAQDPMIQINPASEPPSERAGAAALPPRARRWRASPLIRASLLLHVAVAPVWMLEPMLWPWWLGLIVLDHLVLTAAGLWPRAALLGPNWRTLPARVRPAGAVALTIDDGPDARVTPKVLEILDRYGVRVTFFCIGERVRAHPELIAAMVDAGHAIENHSQTHPLHFSLFGPGRMHAEIAAAQDTISQLAGVRPRFFRAPAGLRNPFLEPVLARLGLRLVSWSRRAFDTREGDPRRVLARLVSGLGPGAILLLHDGNAARTPAGQAVILEVLPRLIEHIRAAGLEPITLRDALAGREEG